MTGTDLVERRLRVLIVSRDGRLANVTRAGEHLANGIKKYTSRDLSRVILARYFFYARSSCQIIAKRQVKARRGPKEARSRC